ncbi:MAG: DNA translocase FtsK 4TM domain-containing protein, partial [Planctomycetota bacterium]
MSETAQRKIRNDIVAVVLLGLIVFLIASLATYDPADQVSESIPVLTRIYQPDQLIYPANAEIQNACGRFGAWTADMLIHVLGVGAYYLVIGLVFLEVALFRARSMNSPWVKTVGWIVSMVGLATLGTLTLPTWTLSPVIGAGGYLGALSGGLLQMNVGYFGALIISLSVSLVGLMMWTEYLVFRAGRFVFAPTLVAASRLLPFGLAHGFFTWFNGLSEPEEELEDEEFDDELVDDEDEDDVPRTIRIRRRGLDSDGDQITEVAAMGQTALVDEESEIEDELEEGVAEESAGDEEWEEDEDEFEEELEDEAEEDEPMTIPLVKGKDLQEMIEDEEPEDLEDEEVVAATEPPTVPHKPHFKVRDQTPPKKTEREEVMEQLDNASMHQPQTQYELPAIDLLSRGGAIDFEIQERQALAQAQVLEQTCREFGYEVKVVEIETGPVISQFELDLEPGLRLAKIVALEPDLAIKMRVPSVRIVPSSPGKNTVGVEVPNKTRQIVHLRSVMEQSEKQINKMKIPLFLGKDAVGAPMV